MGKNNFDLGKIGERVALKFLKKQGFKIIQTNFQNKRGRRLGEIDIIARKNNQLIFVEVKSRWANAYASTLPEENITFHKINRLQKIIQYYLQQHQEENTSWRLDAISVWITQNKHLKINPQSYFSEQNIHYFCLRSYFFQTIAHCWIKHMENIYF